MKFLKSYIGKNGQRIVISKMSNDHLENAIRFFEKQKDKLDKDTTKYYYGSVGPQGEMAQDAFEGELRAREDFSSSLGVLLASLYKELKEREKN